MHKWMHICESIRGRLLVVEKVKSCWTKTTI